MNKKKKSKINGLISLDDLLDDDYNTEEVAPKRMCENTLIKSDASSKARHQNDA